MPATATIPRALALVGLTTLASGCTNFIMDNKYGLTGRTMDLGPGPIFSLLTQPRGLSAGIEGVGPTRLAHIISVAAGGAGSIPPGYEQMAFAGLNEAGLSCDLHALLNSSYPPLPVPGMTNVMLYNF